MNSGKIFERQWRKSANKCDGLFYYRFNDSPSAWSNDSGNSVVRFTNYNICDIMMFKSPSLFLLELKSHTGSSLPHNCIRQNQIEGLLKASKFKNVNAGIVVLFADKNKCFYLPIQKLQEQIDTSNRKSVPISYFEENGIEIEIKSLRVNKNYNVDRFVTDLINKGEQNNA